jgi:hypothetical protein
MAAFAAHPLNNGQAAGLEVSEATELAQCLPQLQLFARSLVNKRRRIAKRILALSATALEGRFDEAFDRYAAMPLNAGAGKHRQDAWLFCWFLAGGASQRQGTHHGALRALCLGAAVQPQALGSCGLWRAHMGHGLVGSGSCGAAVALALTSWLHMGHLSIIMIYLGLDQCSKPSRIS